MTEFDDRVRIDIDRLDKAPPGPQFRPEQLVQWFDIVSGMGVTTTQEKIMTQEKIIKYAIVLSVCLFTASVIAEDAEIPKHEGSAELQKIKGLVGTWVGEMDHGQGPQKVQIVYRVTAAGSAVMETFNPGTPMEMVTMYHDEKGKLAMTHYCMLGNQPKMRLVHVSDKTLALDLVQESDIGKDEPHMNALTIDFLDADRIRQTWGCCQGGDKITNMSVEFKRNK